ncbi:hypothetical protein ACIRG5_38735 [Lentzea sp. NPDC102401]|uniref:hypothetical protein n=1 Tax=Lentzea sp. NPDC102401 TaxID=3364128 RepID=UPI003821B8FB
MLRLTREERVFKPFSDLKSLCEGDEVALFRHGRGGGVIAYGYVTIDHSGGEPLWMRSYVSIKFTDLFFDRPISQARLRAFPARRTESPWLGLRRLNEFSKQ